MKMKALRFKLGLVSLAEGIALLKRFRDAHEAQAGELNILIGILETTEQLDAI